MLYSPILYWFSKIRSEYPPRESYQLSPREVKSSHHFSERAVILPLRDVLDASRGGLCLSCLQRAQIAVKLEQSLLAHRLGIFSTAKTKKSRIITTGLGLFWSEGDERYSGFRFHPCKI
jgi:hypothetical protein